MCVIILVERSFEAAAAAVSVCVWGSWFCAPADADADAPADADAKGRRQRRVFPTAEDTPSEITQRFLMCVCLLSFFFSFEMRKENNKKKKGMRENKRRVFINNVAARLYDGDDALFPWAISNLSLSLFFFSSSSSCFVYPILYSFGFPAMSLALFIFFSLLFPECHCVCALLGPSLYFVLYYYIYSTLLPSCLRALIDSIV